MARYGSADITITVTDATPVTPVAVDISDDVLEFSGINTEVLTEESHGFGDDWVEHASTGLKNGGEITLSGFYNDEEDGVHDVLKGIGDTREIVVTWGGSKTSTAPVLIKSYNRTPARGELTKFNSTLLVIGEPVEA